MQKKCGNTLKNSDNFCLGGSVLSRYIQKLCLISKIFLASPYDAVLSYKEAKFLQSDVKCSFKMNKKLYLRDLILL